MGVEKKKVAILKQPIYSNYKKVVIFLAIFVALGVGLKFLSKATSSVTTFEPEAGSLEGGAVVASDTNASNGKFVQFSSTSTGTAQLTSTGFQPSAPYYATFYYPWYKNPLTDGSYSYWQDNGNNPPNSWFSHYLPDLDPSKFDPSTELYSSDDYNTFKWQLAKMAEAKQEVAIASWFGQGSKQDVVIQKYLNDFMKRSDNPYPNLRWAIYYECEGITTAEASSCPSSSANPTTQQIVADLTHIKANMINSPYILRVNGKPVIFVYGSTEGTDTLTRWHDANAQLGNMFYVIQKVFSGYASASPQPDSWHQYSPASSYGSFGAYSSFVSPGFWKDVHASPDGDVRLDRNLARFQNDVTSMVSSNTTWKLVETWNEWGEGSSVEPGMQTIIDDTGKEVADPNGKVFGNEYIKALSDRLPALEKGTGKITLNDKQKISFSNWLSSVNQKLVSELRASKQFALRLAKDVRNSLIDSSVKLANAIISIDTAKAASTPSFIFTSGGDHGANSSSALTFGNIDKSGAKFYLALGDLDYDQTSSDAAWCTYVKSKLPTLFSNPSFPFQIVSGNHEEQDGRDGYVLNHAACLPDRMNSSGSFPGQYYFDYPAANPTMRVIMISPNLVINNIKYDYTKGTQNFTWLASAIDQARAANIPWITVGMHKNCITAGVKSCEITNDLINLLASKKVDIILQGHEHNYQRSQQLAINSTTCTALSGSTYNSSCVVPRTDPNTYIKGAGPLILIHGIFGRGGSSYPINTGDPSYPYMVKTAANDTNRGHVEWTVTPDRIDARFVNSGGNLADSFAIASTGNVPPPIDTTAPVASLQSPSNGSTVSGTTTISSAASDNVAVTKVDFYVDGNMISSDAASPYQIDYDTTKLTNGNHTIQVKAYDAAGNTGVSATNTFTVSNGCAPIHPTYGHVTSSINVPGGNYNIWVRMMATDANNNAVGLSIGAECPVVVGDSSSVSVSQWTWVNYKNGNQSTPIQFQLSPGSQALNLYGNEAGVKVDRVLIVDSTCIPTGTGDNCSAQPDTTPPTVQIGVPANNSVVSGSFNINVTANDASGVSRVEFYVDNLLIGTDTSNPYSTSYDSRQLKPGTHTIKAVAYDSAGNNSNAQSTITVKDTTAPQVNIKSPVNNASVKGTVTLSASATDSNTLANANFLIDNQLLNTIVGAGPDYIINWDSKTVPNGSHKITVNITDSSGNIGSSSVQVNVDNDNVPPTPPTSVTARAISSSEIQINWSGATDNVSLAGYYVLRNGSVVATIDTNTASYVDKNLSPSTSYVYNVVTYDSAGLSSVQSSSATATTASIVTPDTTPPSTPQNLTASTPNNNQVNLTWAASSDTGGSGLTGYKVLRNGTQIGVVTSTSYLDGTVEPGNSYNYQVVATDGAGNNSSASNTASVTIPKSTTMITLPAITASADAFIAALKPITNYGSYANLRSDKNPINDTLLKFVVSKIDGRQVVSAKLKIYVTNSSHKSGTIRKTSFEDWNESKVTWITAPQPTEYIATIGAARRGQWRIIDVTSLVGSDGVYSLRIRGSSTDGMHFASKETTNKPQLIITVK